MVLEKVSEETKKEVKKKKEIVQVVAKLPVQEVRRVENEDVIVNYVTIEEFLTAQANAEAE